MSRLVAMVERGRGHLSRLLLYALCWLVGCRVHELSHAALRVVSLPCFKACRASEMTLTTAFVSVNHEFPPDITYNAGTGDISCLIVRSYALEGKRLVQS